MIDKTYRLENPYFHDEKTDKYMDLTRHLIVEINEIKNDLPIGILLESCDHLPKGSLIRR